MKALRKTRDVGAEAQKRQAALDRLMFWSMQIGEQKKKYEQTGQLFFKNYNELIPTLCLLKHINQAHQFFEKKEFTIEIDYPVPQLMSFLFFKIYYAEMKFTPWGIATETEIQREIEHQGKTIRLSRLPNFLLPLDCLYCGEPLGFKTYQEAAYNIVKHPECSSLWSKNIRKKHLVAAEAIKHPSQADKDLIFDALWDSYKEMIHLLDKEYRPRYTLIDAYKDIPNHEWVAPYSGLKPKYDLLTLPFLKGDVRKFGLSTSAESDGEPLRWETYDPETMPRAITLANLESYFIKSPKPSRD